MVVENRVEDKKPIHRVVKRKGDKKEEPKKHVNLCEYALSLASKKLNYIARSEDKSHMDEITKIINTLIKNETGVSYDEVIKQIVDKKMRVHPSVQKLLAGSIRVIARQIEALRIVHSYNIEV